VTSIRIKRLPSAEGLPLPQFTTAGAAGADLHAAIFEPMALAPGTRALVPSGLSIAIPNGWEAQIRPRSGLALKYGVTVLNTPGTIDSDYRGEISVILINHGDAPFTVARGDRIAQIVFAPVSQPALHEVGELPETDRGSGGFGSTGGIS